LPPHPYPQHFPSNRPRISALWSSQNDRRPLDGLDISDCTFRSVSI
jgi:hypothetical protein